MAAKVQQRDALEVLTRARLIELAQGFELDVTTRSNKDELIETLARSKRASYPAILGELSRDELKEICRAQGFSEKGKRKAVIAERILGREVAEPGESASGSGKRANGGREGSVVKRGRRKKSAKLKDSEEELEEDADEEGKLTLQKLESHLWGAANILRGSIDSADFKHYIFGLLFYKRLCDVWQEEYKQRLAEFEDEELAADPEEHRFDIPSEHSWKEVRKHSTNIGEHLNMAFHGIEDANIRLRGVFQDVDFNNKERFPDAVLERLLQHFEKYRLRHEDVEDDVLGNAYEYLIAKFADDAGKKGGEFYTPKMVVRLMVECVQPDEGMSVYDPTCGSGGMLLEAIDYLKRDGKNPRALTLYGQERNLNTWAICKMNMFLHGIDDVFIERGDTLRDPKHLRSQGAKSLMRFERVLANPPFSLDEWGHEQWKSGDKYSRDVFGCPPKPYADYAFVQHMLASVDERGLVGVVLPHGVLFRPGAEAAIRKQLVESDLIDTIIGLAPRLFYGTPIPACIMFLAPTKPAERRGRVRLIDGTREFTTGETQNVLSPANVEEILRAFRAPDDIPGLARSVPLTEIAENGFSLSLNRYFALRADDDDEPQDLAFEIAALEELRGRRDAAEARVRKHLAALVRDV